MIERAITLRQQVEGIMQTYAFDLAEVRARFQWLWDQRRFHLIGGNVHFVARDALTIGGTMIRTKKDTASAISWFRKACEVVPWLKRVAVCETDSPLVEAFMFYLPLMVCILAKNFSLAREIGETFRLRLPYIRVDSNDAVDVWAMMICACVLDDKKWFSEQESIFIKIKKKPHMYELYAKYVPLMNSVMARDGNTMNSQLRDCETLYFERKRDRKLMDVDAVHGGMDDNDVAIDFLATALAIVGVSRGLEMSVISDVIPKDLIEYDRILE